MMDPDNMYDMLNCVESWLDTHMVPRHKYDSLQEELVKAKQQPLSPQAAAIKEAWAEVARARNSESAALARVANLQQELAKIHHDRLIKGE